MSSPFIVIDEITTKMNEINSSLTTKIDMISSNTAVNNTASSTGTLSQKLSHLCQQIGTSADPASGGTTSGGTAMSKLNAILSKANSGVNAKTESGKVILFAGEHSAVGMSSTYTKTILNVTGSGSLISAVILPQLANSTSYATLKITVDGIVYYNLKMTTTTNSTTAAVGIFYPPLMYRSEYNFFVPAMASSCISVIGFSQHTEFGYKFSQSASQKTLQYTSNPSLYNYYQGILNYPIRFNSSLKVEVSMYNSHTKSAYGIQSGVQYTLD